ncbi:MAG: MATE family efflux transporter [Planctomycetota bacterium]
MEPRTRIQDIRELLQTAWPLMLSTGLFSITLFVDRLFLFQYSDAAAAAAMSAGTLFWSVTCLPAGICGYTSTFVAQYLGVRRVDRAMHVVWQGCLLALALSPILVLLGLFSYRLFVAFGHSPELAKFEYEFFLGLVPGACATILSSALVGLFAGSGRPIVLLYCDAIATATNVVLDYGMIFGNLGFPRWGVAGAAIASSISLSLKCILLVIFAYWYLRNNRFGAWPIDSSMSNKLRDIFKLDFPLMRRLIRFGWPAGVSVVAEAWSFAIIMMIVGNLGERPAAATTLALGVNVLAFIPLIGLGIAVGVLVGKYLVQSELATAQRVVQAALTIGVIYSGVFAVLYGLFPDQVMNVYAIGNDPVRFEAIKPELKPLLYFIAAYCVFDSFQVIFSGVLKGAGDTLFVLLGHAIAGFGTVGLAIVGQKLFGWDGLYYWWGVISVWVVVLAIIFTARYLHGGWKSKRVIEPDLLADA